MKIKEGHDVSYSWLKTNDHEQVELVQKVPTTTTPPGFSFQQRMQLGLLALANIAILALTCWNTIQLGKKLDYLTNLETHNYYELQKLRQTLPSPLTIP